jgi:hypothetical protein
MSHKPLIDERTLSSMIEGEVTEGDCAGSDRPEACVQISGKSSREQPLSDHPVPSFCSSGTVFFSVLLNAEGSIYRTFPRSRTDVK